MATMKEVANYARVSVATVSRVINNSGYVSPDLELRVRKAMTTLKYQPSSLARSLRRQITQTIGVLIPQLDDPFFSTLAFAIERFLFTSDHRTLICSAEEDLEKESGYVDMLLRQRVDGVIVVPTGYSAQNLYRLQENKVPIVLVDRDLSELKNVNKVLSDNYGGSYAGMQHLLQLGHRNIGVIGITKHIEPLLDRVRGIKQALNDFDVDYHPDRLVQGTMRQFKMGYTAAMELLNQSSPPTAIFALTDVMAIGAMHAASRLGLRLPQDLSIVGYDDIPLAAYSIPELTTVSQPIYTMGETAARILLAQIADNEKPIETTVLHTPLIIRKSTAPLQN